MGNLYEYFAAADDHAATMTLEHSPDPAHFEVLAIGGIEPAVQLATLEALLRGVDYEHVAADPRQCALLSDPVEESRWVVSVTDSLRDALADASAHHLARIALTWSEAEEFRGRGDADLLGDFLTRFAHLASAARTRGHHIYCWMSL